jgi:hypothetical protein
MGNEKQPQMKGRIFGKFEIRNSKSEIAVLSQVEGRNPEQSRRWRDEIIIANYDAEFYCILRYHSSNPV